MFVLDDIVLLFETTVASILQSTQQTMDIQVSMPFRMNFFALHPLSMNVHSIIYIYHIYACMEVSSVWAVRSFLIHLHHWLVCWLN